MYNIDFENLLGKTIFEFKEVVGEDFENEFFKNSFYCILDESINKDYYGMSYNCLSITTDKNENLKSITVHFRETIGHDFYEAFIENYGEPSNILIIENRKIINKSTFEENDFKQDLTKSTFDLREGAFEENPLYIIWSKENYQIKAFLRHSSNISEITFSTLTDD